jgi:ribosomal protein S18 acetylase RimI-like enzyme
MSQLTKMEPPHIPAVADLHASALAGDFLPTLGERFLQVFYRSVLKNKLGFGFVELLEGVPIGFVLGSIDSSNLFRKVIMHAWVRLGLAALPVVIRKPGLLLKVAETFLYPNREAQSPEKAELLVIAVNADQRGRGFGEKLVAALNQEMSVHGIQSYKVTVLQSNQGANRFYQRLGFQKTGQFKLYGQGWNIYLKRIGAVQD